MSDVCGVVYRCTALGILWNDSRVGRRVPEVRSAGTSERRKNHEAILPADVPTPRVTCVTNTPPLPSWLNAAPQEAASPICTYNLAAAIADGRGGAVAAAWRDDVSTV